MTPAASEALGKVAVNQAKKDLLPPLDARLLLPCAEPALAADDKLETVLRTHARNGKEWYDCRRDKLSLIEYVKRYIEANRQVD